MKTAICVIFLLLGACESRAVAQEQTNGEKAADWISSGLVGVNVGADAYYSVRHHCIKNFVLKNVITIGAAEGTKLFVHEDRPDHSDLKSFYSEHSAMAMVNSGWSFSWGFSIGLGTGAGRVISRRHHDRDVVVGLLAGLGAQYLFPCNP